MAGALALSAGAAQAHPHIWVDAKAKLDFNAAGELTAIHNTWVFDEALSVWQVQGLDTNNDGITSPEELQPLADDNLKGLAEYGFYTSAGTGAESIALHATDQPRYVFDNNRLTFTFSIAPDQPYRLQHRFELSVADPEYYVAITFASTGFDADWLSGISDAAG